MNVESFSIGELCSSVSERYTENLPYVRLVNTSDILEGELLPLENIPKTLSNFSRRVRLVNDLPY